MRSKWWLSLPLWIALFVLALPVLVIAVPQLWVRHAHDQRLKRLEVSVANLKHPPGTRELAIESDLGLLQGNGNHCDYFVGALRAGPVAQLARADDDYIAQHAEVMLLDETDWFGLQARARLIEAGRKLTPSPGETFYVVWLFDQTAPESDFRCH